MPLSAFSVPAMPQMIIYPTAQPAPVREDVKRNTSEVAAWFGQGVKVDTVARTLRFGGSTLDPCVQLAYEGQQCREVTTRGDGDCAVHAAFGDEVSDRGELFCADPKSLVRTLLGVPWEKIKAEARPHT